MQWTHEIGLAALQAIFLADAERVAGPKNKHQLARAHNHWGSTNTALEFGGRRISVRRPRVRRRSGGETELPTAKYFQSFDALPETVLQQILLGLSTRGYEASVPLPPPGTKSRGTARSAVSRQLVARMSEKMRAELARPLDQPGSAVTHISFTSSVQGSRSGCRR